MLLPCICISFPQLQAPMSHPFMIVLATVSGLLSPRQPPETVYVRLADLAATALAREVTLRARAYDAEIARADVLDARSAFDPVLQLRGDASGADVASLTSDGRLRQRLRGRTLSSNLAGNTPWSTQYAASLESVWRGQNPLTTQGNLNEYDNLLTFAVTQPLLRGFGAASGQEQVSAATSGLRATEAQLRRLAELTVADVERLYWVLEQRQEEEAVAEQSLWRAETLVRRNTELRKLDKVTENDLTTARLGVAERRNALVRAVQSRQDATDDLISFAYGDKAREQYSQGDRVFRAVDAPVLALELPPAAQAESLALIARNDLAAARLNLERYRQLRNLSRNTLLPTVNLTGSYTTIVNNASSVRLRASRLGDVESSGWSMGLSARVPLANSSARATAVQQNALYAQQAITISGVENQVRNEVHQARRAVETGGRVLALADTAVALGQQQFSMEVQRLDLGLSDSFRLLQQEEQIANAQFAQIAARYELALAVMRFEVASGRDMLRKYQLETRGLH